MVRYLSGEARLERFLGVCPMAACGLFQNFLYVFRILFIVSCAVALLLIFFCLLSRPFSTSAANIGNDSSINFSPFFTAASL